MLSIYGRTTDPTAPYCMPTKTLFPSLPVCTLSTESRFTSLVFFFSGRRQAFRRRLVQTRACGGSNARRPQCHQARSTDKVPAERDERTVGVRRYSLPEKKVGDFFIKRGPYPSLILASVLLAI